MIPALITPLPPHPPPHPTSFPPPLVQHTLTRHEAEPPKRVPLLPQPHLLQPTHPLPHPQPTLPQPTPAPPLPRDDRRARQRRKLARKVLRQLRIRNHRPDRRLTLPPLQSAPVDMAEEAMFLDRQQVLRHRRPEALARFLAQQARQQVLGVRREEIRQREFLLEDLLLRLRVVRAAEGGGTRQEIEAQHAERPPVHGVAVVVAQDHFGRHVLDRAAEGVAAHVAVDGDFAEAEVREQQVAFRVEEAVFWFQVTVEHADGLVEVVEGEDHFRHVEGRRGFGEHALGGEVGEELAALGVLEDEVEFLAVLEGVVEFYNEGVAVDAFEDGALGFGLFDEPFLHGEGGFAELLLGEEPAGRGLFYEVDGAEGAFPEAHDGVKVCCCHLSMDAVLHWGIWRQDAFVLLGVPAYEIVL